MNVLSLFDGMSCGRIALDRAGIEVSTYYAAEIDKYATKVSEANYPDIIRLGDVTQWRDWGIDWKSIDLVTGGFPCQAWSLAGKQLGDKDERGKLFWVMLDIIKQVKHYNPNAKFLIENVKMKKEFEQYITTHTENALGEVYKTLINSALVSAQNRNRYYWTNFEVTQPEDKGIVLSDVIEDTGNQFVMCDKSQTLLATLYKENAKSMVKRNKKGLLVVSEGGDMVDRDKSHRIDANYYKGGNLKSYFEKNRRQLVFCSAGRDASNERRLRAKSDKSPTLTARYYKGVKSDGAPFVYSGDKEKGDLFDYNTDLHYRKLTPTECERLQTVPDGFTAHVSNTQRYKILGNGWTVDVIAHIFKEMIK